MGLVWPPDGDDDFCSDDGDVLPASGFGVAELLLAGETDLISGVEDSFFSSLLCTLDLDDGRSSFLDTTFVSYGLKASFVSVGVDL